MTLRQIIRLRSIAFCLVCHHNMLFPPAHSKGCKIREFSFQSNFPFVYTLSMHCHHTFKTMCLGFLAFILIAEFPLVSFFSFTIYFPPTTIYSSFHSYFTFPFIFFSFFSRFYSHCDFHSICTPSLHSFASNRGLILPLNPFNQTFFSFLSLLPFHSFPLKPPSNSPPPPFKPRSRLVIYPILKHV